MKSLCKNFIFYAILIFAVACSEESEFSVTNVDTPKTFLEYESSLKHVNNITESLDIFLANNKGRYQNKSQDQLVQEFIEIYASEEIDNLLSDIDVNGKLIYDSSFSEIHIDVSDIENLEISNVEKQYLSALYFAVNHEDAEALLGLLSDFKNDKQLHPELENLNLIFAFIEFNQFSLLNHKNSITAKDCSDAVIAGGTIGGVWGMIRGAVIGGITGTVLGLNPGTGAAGAVVGAVGGGVVGYVEGAILGYIGCQIFG